MSGSRRSRWLAGGTAAVAIAAIAYQALSAMDLRREATVSIIVLVGVLGLLVQRRIALAQRRDAEAERVRLLDDALAWWPPPLVREANPYELGAHPPTSGDYSTREVDVVLEAALAGPGYTLVIGPAGSGKSRAAFEALRRARPEARLLVPEDEASLARLIAGDPQLPDGPQGTILWLDCVDRFLPGLRLDAVDAWIRGAGIVVVATITRETLASLLEGSSPEAHIARRLVARSAAVSVADVLTPAELAAAGDRFPERDFAAGMAGAFRTGWVPAPEPAFSFPPRSAAAPAGRPDASTWLLVIALAVAGAFLWATNDRYDGLAEPPPLADQIVDLGLDLARCGRQTFAGTAESLEARNVLVATVDRDRECESHPRGADPVLVYEYREKRLVPVHDFGPPPGTLPADATFGCRGAPPNPCWTDVTGRGDFAIIGVFRSPRSEALLPVAAWKDDADGWQVAPLVTKAPPLEAGFRAAAYSEPVAGNAHRVADIAVLPPTEGERDLPARVVLGFAPRKALAAPHKLELRAHPLRAGTRVGLDRRCLVVRRGVPDAHLQVPVKPRDAPLSDVLRAAWQRREETGQGICVLSR